MDYKEETIKLIQKCNNLHWLKVIHAYVLDCWDNQRGGGLLPCLNIRKVLLWREKTLKVENLRVGEYYDEKNQRYMFRKMVDGERVTITAASLADLRKQENDFVM